MNNLHFEKAKKLVIIGLASDDVLLEYLVLKGGNAITIGHKINDRGSKDIDYSMEGDFGEQLEGIKKRMEKSLKSTFSEEGYYLFDFMLQEKPTNLRNDLKSWWGGYKLDFKIIQNEKHDKFKGNSEDLRRNAIPLHENNSSKFEVEISKHEFVKKKEIELDGYIVYVYPVELIVAEKLRAICQQFPEYKLNIVGNKTLTNARRPRDFYDIYSLLEFSDEVNIRSDTFKSLLIDVFQAKRVPIEWLDKIEQYREYHKSDYAVLKNTVTAEIEEFDFYFDYVLNNVIANLSK